MDITGKLVLILPEQRGESARGPWVRGGFVIETEEQYPRKIAFSIWGEDLLTAVKSVPLGNTIKVNFYIESREYQERWYTDLRCRQIETFVSAMNNGTVAGLNPQMPYQQQPQQMSYGQKGMQQPAQGVQYAQQPQYQQPPQYQQSNSQPQQMNGGTVEQSDAAMPADEDDLPF